jgi:hypothetical protein
VAEIAVANQAALSYQFEVHQAQRLYSCENQDLMLSWAVAAKLR